ncbi:recombinase family protein [Lentzea sp. NPDC005914]|uniref:recombinase family protein n=1 Tax=Lentzea sp. NPDC005914 TaxID=3154572 RepID=UPI0033C60939
MTKDSTTQTSNSNGKQATALEAATQRARTRPPRNGSHATGRAVPIAFVYLRVSTREQARTGGGIEGYSIPAQRQACHAKAAQLGAAVEREFVDAGESGRSSDRDDLQDMLAEIKIVRPDYLIIHKIDRLARNRADDIAINLLLKRHGVTLVSCTENIDDTPSGKLLYGLLAEIAQFYSGNLAQEVLKGLVRKAEEGGTPFCAPIGYLNKRETIGRISISSVILDPERAELVRWCFEQYATGEWSGIDLLLAARARGLSGRPTAKNPTMEISLTGFYYMLQNPYYMGIVPYRGIHYEGKHPALVEPEVWLAVQDILAANAHDGEKDRTHNHYLRSTIYCSSCRGKLVFSQSSGNGGTYAYFQCVKKKTKRNNCHRRAVRVERIENGIADFYAGFRLSEARAEDIRASIRAELVSQQTEGSQRIARAVKRKTIVGGERQKLLQAHYAGAVPTDLLALEMRRFTRELAEADVDIQAASVNTAELAATLEAALRAAANCEAAYLAAPNHVRRQINQGFFKKLYIGEDGNVEEAELTEPFAALLDGGAMCTIPAEERAIEAEADQAANGLVLASQIAVRPLALVATGDAAAEPDLALGTFWAAEDAATDRDYDATPGDFIRLGVGVNKTYLVGATGIEPATARV